MANKRTILASTWTFAPDAAQELSQWMQNVDPEHIKCTYRNHDKTFVVEGDNVEKSLHQLTYRMTEFIQQEVNKDSLDLPRVCRAEIPEVTDSNREETTDSIMNSEENLLDFDSDDEHESQVFNDKWTSNGSGIGYFTNAPPGLLKELGSLTGTDITVESNSSQLLVSGKYPDDVKEAMDRLTRMDQPLSLTNRAILGHVLETPGIDAQFQLVNYRSRAYPAPRRILGGVESAAFAQMLVTAPVLTEGQRKALGQETCQATNGASKGANKFRHWVDFRYPEFGNGKKYLDLKPIIPNNEKPFTTAVAKKAELGVINDAPSTALAKEHPHLAPEVATRVDRWVTQTSSSEKEPELADVPVSDVNPQPQSQLQLHPEAPTHEPKRVKGVKKRVPIKLAQRPLAKPVSTDKLAPVIMNPSNHSDAVDDIGGRSNEPSHDAPVIPELPKHSDTVSVAGEHRDKASIDVLLDLSSPSVDATPSVAVPSFYQRPLIPTSKSVTTSDPSIYADELLLHSPVVTPKGPNPDVVDCLKTILSNVALESEIKKPCAVRETFKQCLNHETYAKLNRHETMKQKASPGSETSTSPGAERQLRLEEMWQIRPKTKARQAVEGLNKAKDDEQIKKLFSSLQPALEAAQSFPGVLALEMQIGTILLPCAGRNSDAGIMSMNHWDVFFRPANNTFVPGTRFVNRSTASGSDADSILDLSANEGGDRMFEDEVDDGGIVYEFQCKTQNARSLSVSIDESGDVQVKEAHSVLGIVNVHFPFKVWDASMSLQGTLAYQWGFDKALDNAIQSLVQSVWVQPGRALLRMFYTVSEGDLISIEKVLMKRWTRHRHVRSPSTGKNETNASDLNDRDMKSDLLLQITEVQDLVTGIHPADTSVLRARSDKREEMAQKGRLWFETSIVSSSIEDILRSNSTLELGEKTKDWEAIDLLGDAVGLLGANYASKPVARVIGNSGIRDMYRLAKLVVERIDHVGHPEEKRPEAMEQQEWNSIGAAGGRLDSSRSTGSTCSASLARVNLTALNHVREVGSKSQDVKRVMDKDAASAMALSVKNHKKGPGEFW